MNPTTIERAERQTVQALPEDPRKNGASSTSDFWFDSVMRSELLPEPYTISCERWLRYYDNHNANTLWHGTKSGQIKKIGATGYEMSGGRNLTAYYSEMFGFGAQFGDGFRQMIELLANDYFVYNRGAFMEIIAPGNPLREPTGRITGLAHLDSYHCLPTGNPDYPIIYTDRDAKQHILHRSRVVQFVDTPNGDQNHPGFGRSALWRSIQVIWQEILMGRYVVANLDDKPPPGMVLVGGMTREKWNAAWATYLSDQSADTRPDWGKNIPIFSLDADHKATVEIVPFSVAPDKFDYQIYTELDVHKFALAVGVDIQELWELTGGNLGSGQQSEVQHSKSQGKTYGEFLSTFERAVNYRVLPPSLEFKFKVEDPYQSAQEADNAGKWAAAISGLGGILSPNEQRQLAADKIEAVRSAITDEEGEVIRLPGGDPQDMNQSQDVTAEDQAPTTEGQTGDEATAQDDTPNAKKDFDATARGFSANLADLLAGSDDISRRRAGVVFRALVSKYGRSAYGDGLKAGGVEDGLSTDDLNAVMVLTAQQTAYVTAFLDSAYANGLTESAIAAHVEMWTNKSLQMFFDAGRLSADANGVYEWQLGAAEHCKSCLAMSGQKHRLREYAAKGIFPKSDKLACRGFMCACRLVKTSGASVGYWL